jgi:hypothetical protein
MKVIAAVTKPEAVRRILEAPRPAAARASGGAGPATPPTRSRACPYGKRARPYFFGG